MLCHISNMISDQKPGPESSITTNQVRAARALLGWSQRDLAKNAKIAVSTVADFERGQRVPVPANIQAIRDAIASAGIVFTAGGAVAGGKHDRALAARPNGQPIRLIGATDLDHWSDRRDAQEQLPELISRLIRAEAGHAARLRFPSGEGVQFRGWDGACEIDQGTVYVPPGRSVWELSTQSRDPPKKAAQDLKKRTAATDADEQASTSVVLVTSRRLSDKDRHEKAWRKLGQWREVRVIDAEDLVHWIELHPAVGNWFAALMGKRPEGVLQLEDVWEEWARSTHPEMSPQLLLAGRDEDAAKIHRWLQDTAEVVSFQGESIEEAVAFLFAAVDQFPGDDRARYLVRAIVATSAAAARILGDGPSHLILVLMEAEPGLAERLAARGHHVYAAYGAGAGAPADLPQLARPPRAEIEWALKSMGLPEQEAARYARDSGRSLAVLRRLIPAAPGQREPAWAEQPVARELIPALLAGAWDERNPADQTVLAALGDCTFEDFIGKTAPKLSASDSPLRKIGSSWKLASPKDAWFRLAPYLTQRDLDRFELLAIDVLGGEAQTAESARPSALIQAGMAETLLVMAIYPKRASAATNAHATAHFIVRELLHGADGDRWRSVGPHLRVLAEASPGGFLACLDRSLHQQDPPVMALFDPRQAQHTNLLWALETLAWDDRLLSEVAGCLAALARLDPPNARYGNRPASSLREIFLLWLPQTAATLRQRLRIIDGLRHREPEAAWQLMIGLIPGEDTATPSPPSHWRAFPTENAEPVTYGLIALGANEILNRLLADVGTNAARWSQMIQLLPRLEPERRQEIMTRLSDAAPVINDPEECETILHALRHILSLHREIADADWALPENDLRQLQAIYDSLQPADAVQRCLWLFENAHIELPDAPGDYKQKADALQKARKAAVERIVKEQGADGLRRLADSCGIPQYVGLALAQSKIDPGLAVAFMGEGFRSERKARQEFASGLLIGRLRASGAAPALALVKEARADGWAPQAVARIFLCMDQTRRVWDLIASLGPEVDDFFWSKIDPLWASDGKAGDVEFAIRRMVRSKRAGQVLGLVYHVKETLDCRLIVEVLEAAAMEPGVVNATIGGRTMNDWYVQELLKHLDRSDEIDEGRMAQLELAYLPVLRFAGIRPEGRPPRVLYRRILNDPELFVQLICTIYRPDPESGIEEAVGQKSAAASTNATQAYELLRSLRGVPGSDGSSVDAARLEQWVAQARRLCDKAGRASVGDFKIGELLANSAVGADGAWPAEPIREVIEISMSRRLEEGILGGRCNLRGPTSRPMGEGGDQERDLARTYRQWSRATRLEWPRTSALLERLAQTYDEQARWHDGRADQLDWKD
jgi:transcriptional regulator with XRE-family HTH domain